MQPLVLAPALPYFSMVKPYFLEGSFPILSHSVTPVNTKVISNVSSSILGAFSVPDIYFSRFLLRPIRQSSSLSWFICQFFPINQSSLFVPHSLDLPPQSEAKVLFLGWENILDKSSLHRN